MRARQAKTTYQWVDAVERLKSLRYAIEVEERVVHAVEWRLTKAKAKLDKLEHTRDKVAAGLVRRA